MRVLVTGAHGFVGRALTARLSAEPGVEVVAVTRGSPEPAAGGMRWIRADLARAGWTECLPGGVDTVVHLAQSKRYREFPAGAPDMMAVNVNAAFELVHWAASNGVKRFVQASTGNVYRPAAGPLTEGAQCAATSMYSASKLCAEHIVQQYSTLLETVILRVFSVYGPGQTDMLIPRMVDRVAAGEEIVLASGAGLYLTPLHVRDCVDMLCRALRPDSGRPGIYNLCGSETLTLGEMVSMIATLLGNAPRVRRTEAQAQHLVGDGSLFAATFGVGPAVPFRTGISELIGGRIHDGDVRNT